MKHDEAIKKWTTALRSGEYTQGNGVLFDGENYCCLGVGCEVVEGFSSDYMKDKELPCELTDYSGVILDYENLVMAVENDGNVTTYRLHELNDGLAPDEFTFKMLANVIDYFANGADEEITYDKLLEVANG